MPKNWLTNRITQFIITLLQFKFFFFTYRIWSLKDKPDQKNNMQKILDYEDNYSKQDSRLWNMSPIILKKLNFAV